MKMLLTIGLGLGLLQPGMARTPRPTAASRSAADERVPAVPHAAAAPHWERDPFASLEPKRGSGKPAIRLPGKAGLTVAILQVQGVAVHGPDGNVALVADPEGRTYFLHPGDQIHDATVVSIDAGGIWFNRRIAEHHHTVVYVKVQGQ